MQSTVHGEREWDEAHYRALAASRSSRTRLDTLGLSTKMQRLPVRLQWSFTRQ